jgi:hypothetical protein
MHAGSAARLKPTNKILRWRTPFPKAPNGKLCRFQRGDFVQDLVFVAVTVAFFAVAILYIRACERLK